MLQRLITLDNVGQQWLHSRPLVEFNGLDAVERRRRARGSGREKSAGK